MSHNDDDAIKPPSTPASDEPETDEAARAKEFSRRALLQAGWTAPVILAASLPENAYALSSGHADVHVDAHTDVLQVAFNDFNAADPDDVPDTIANSHSDMHTDVHTDVPPTPAHTDVVHQDGHQDTHLDEPLPHSDVIHNDFPPMQNFETHVDIHTDVHSDGVATPAAPIHIDAHEDSHTDSHVDAHVDHSDAPAHSDVRHVDHIDAAATTIHFDFSCGPTHQDSTHSDGGHWDHGDMFYRSNTNHYDLAAPGPTRIIHCDGPSFADHSDRPVHQDSHVDTHLDRPPHSDSSHGDSHTDAHTDVPHRDVHIDG